MTTTLTDTAQARLAFADLLEALPAGDWARPTLCAGWTVHDLAAHLSLSTRLTLRDAVVGAVRSRFGFDRMIDLMARERAARFTPTELIAQIRETAESPRRAPGAGPLDPLVDALVHTQDLVRALGRSHPMPVGPALAALEHVRTSAFYGARERLAGVRLVATDAGWAAGEGAEAHGTVADLLLVAMGRRADLTGPGAELVASRL